MTATDLDPDTITSRIVASLENADYPSLGDLYASDAVLDMNLPTWRFQYTGAETIRGYFRDQIGGLRNLRCTQNRSVVTAATVMVESECRFDGDDGEYLWRCVDILALDGGRISLHTQYCTGCWTPADIARQAAEAPMVRW
jgi:ketosteroid isomerase-like protein